MPHTMNPHPARRARRGFTLVELLTVVAIVGVLAGIVIPVIGKARESAHSSACASNLRQIAAAALLYAGENKGRLMPVMEGAPQDAAVGRVTWRIKIEPYLGSRRDKQSVLICPSDEITDYPMSSGVGEWPASYGFNTASQFAGSSPLVAYAAGSNSKTMAAVNNPARLIMVSDIGRNMGGGGADPATWTEDRSATSSSLGYARFPWGGSFNLEWSVWPRHGGKKKANAAFYDGHVALVDLVEDLKNKPNGHAECLFDNH